MHMSKGITLLFLLLFVDPMYSQEGIDIWTTTTNSVGNVWGIVIDQSNQNIMYSASNNLGVYKTTNGGTSWAPANNGIVNLAVQAIAISKNNPLYLYCGTNQTGAGAGVYKTTDGGASWTQVNNGFNEPSGLGVQALMVHPDNPNIAWVAIFPSVDVVNGLYKTTDGGANWFPITNGIGTIKNFLCFAMSPVDANTIYAGSSFQVATSTGPSVIYKSTDGGANWFLSSNGLPGASTDINPIRTMQVSALNPNVVIATLFMNTVTGGFYVSNDAGANWTKKHNGLPSDIGQNMRSSAIRPLFDNQFYVGMDGADSLGVWATTDGGNNWFGFSGGTLLNTFVIRALAFNSTGNHTLYAGCSSTNGAGIYEYTFSFIPVELVSFSADVYSNDVVLSWITATETNNYGFEILRSLNDGTQIWETIGFVAGNGTSSEFRNYSFTDVNVAAGNYLYRLKQLDYGGNYSLLKIVEVTVLPPDNYVLMQNYPNPFNPNTRIAFNVPTSSHTILKVTDVIGNVVATLLDGFIPPGSYELDFDASSINGGLPSGVYFYTLQAGDFSVTKKMMLLR
jgi:photosystem II stability/assembly factor-like uncharacterized protein